MKLTTEIIKQYLEEIDGKVEYGCLITKKVTQSQLKMEVGVCYWVTPNGDIFQTEEHQILDNNIIEHFNINFGRANKTVYTQYLLYKYGWVRMQFDSISGGTKPITNEQISVIANYALLAKKKREDYYITVKKKDIEIPYDIITVDLVKSKLQSFTESQRPTLYEFINENIEYYI